MEIQADSVTTQTLQYEILAELTVRESRMGFWTHRTPDMWKCLVCGALLPRESDTCNIRRHLYEIHGISPVQVGFTWIGRPRR